MDQGAASELPCARGGRTALLNGRWKMLLAAQAPAPAVATLSAPAQQQQQLEQPTKLAPPAAQPQPTAPPVCVFLDWVLKPEEAALARCAAAEKKHVSAATC